MQNLGGKGCIGRRRWGGIEAGERNCGFPKKFEKISTRLLTVLTIMCYIINRTKEEEQMKKRKS